MDTLWELPRGAANQEEVANFGAVLEVPEVIAGILLRKGITTREDAEIFFNPRSEYLYDPFQMRDMERAVERINQALINRERILIYGDYDVDGVTSVALLYRFLKDMGGDVIYFIPDRHHDGYGVTRHGVDLALERGVKIMISVDTGITAVDEIQYANECGLDFIICDHHEPGSVLPPALAILNPKCDDHYEFRELAAVGVSYKLVQGVIQRLGLREEILEQYIDLVAIGSSADIVPLISENRIIIKLGLDKINYDCSVGVSALIEVSGIKKNRVDVNQVVFGLAPRINAVGRLGNAERAVDLLVTQNSDRAREIARVLENENRKRKSIDSQTLQEALAQIEETCDLDQDKAIVLYKENWHPGVIGIVASRIIERYYRPTIMLTIENGIAKGSARSIPNFDIYQAVKDCEDLVEQFGGHKYAAGLTVRQENLEEFSRRFRAIAAERLSRYDLMPKLHIDGELTLDQIDAHLLEIIRRFAPFGPKNNQPLFVSFGVELLKGPRKVGSNHLLAKVSQNNAVFDVIGYNLGHLTQTIPPRTRFVDIVYNIEENYWQGRVNVQLYLKDIKLVGDSREIEV